MKKQKSDIESMVINKTISDIDVDGFGIDILFTDGTRFCYNASDGGCSTYEFTITSEGKEE